MSDFRAYTFAVVDIGSNTVKLSVYECTRDGPRVLINDADTVRIGHRVSETGVISAERTERLMACLARFERAARKHGALGFHAVATQAFRIAANSAEIIARIEHDTAWQVRVIDAAEETALTIEGARPWILDGTPTVVADIGGASTEIIAVSADGSILFAGSVPIGSGLVFDEEIAASPPPPGSFRGARNRAIAALDPLEDLPADASTLLLPGGTGHFLSLLLASLDANTSFGPAGIPTLREWLSSRHASETTARIPVQLERAQVLPASLAIVEALVLRLTPADIRAVPSGIRDGIARTVCPAR